MNSQKAFQSLGLQENRAGFYITSRWKVSWCGFTLILLFPFLPSYLGNHSPTWCLNSRTVFYPNSYTLCSSLLIISASLAMFCMLSVKGFMGRIHIKSRWRVEGWGEKAHNCNWITIKIKKKKKRLAVLSLLSGSYPQILRPLETIHPRSQRLKQRRVKGE